MNDADIRAHNAITALHAMYGGMLERAAKEEGAWKAHQEAMMRQIAANARGAEEFAVFRRCVSGMVVDRQQKAKQALALLRALPPADDGLNGVDANVAEIERLLEMMASEQLAMPFIVEAK